MWLIVRNYRCLLPFAMMHQNLCTLRHKAMGLSFDIQILILMVFYRHNHDPESIFQFLIETKSVNFMFTKLFNIAILRSISGDSNANFKLYQVFFAPFASAIYPKLRLNHHSQFSQCFLITFLCICYTICRLALVTAFQYHSIIKHGSADKNSPTVSLLYIGRKPST